jgi:hypothetical protein
MNSPEQNPIIEPGNRQEQNLYRPGEHRPHEASQRVQCCTSLTGLHMNFHGRGIASSELLPMKRENDNIEADPRQSNSPTHLTHDFVVRGRSLLHQNVTRLEWKSGRPLTNRIYHVPSCGVILTFSS